MTDISDAATARRSVSRRWLLLAGAFVAFSVSIGTMQSYTVFLLAFIAAFGWDRAETSLAYSVSQLVSGASSPVVGILVDRFGPRRLLLFGTALLVTGLVASSYATRLWHVVLLYGFVMTFGSTCLGLVVFVPVLSRYFARRRGMAISIVQSANGFGRGGSTPAGEYLIAHVGWRETYLLQAGFVAVVVLPLTFLFRYSRRDSGGPAAAVLPADAPAAASVAPPHSWTLGEAMRTPHFWLLFAVYLLTGLGSYFVSLHQLAFVVDAGFHKQYAAEVLGVGAFLAFFGTIITGTASDYVGRELSAILAYGFSIFGVACALFIQGPQQSGLLWLHACFFGVTWGARGPVITAKTADLFPGPNLGKILGVITIGSGLGAAAGSWGAGWVFDTTGSYRVAFLLSISFYLCACLAFWAMRRPPVLR